MIYKQILKIVRTLLKNWKKRSKLGVYAYECDGEGEHLPTLPTYKISAITWRQEIDALHEANHEMGFHAFVQLALFKINCYFFIFKYYFIIYYYIINFFTPYSQKVALSHKIPANFLVNTLLISTVFFFIFENVFQSRKTYY